MNTATKIQPILVTGAAGFIGFHLCRKLLSCGHRVVGIDNYNDYYDVKLKQARIETLAQSQQRAQFQFKQLDIIDLPSLEALFGEFNFAGVIHLAAQAGVRYSIDHPHIYAQSNVVGFLNILEMCRHQQIGHLVYASSSSVYGLNKQLPFSEHHSVNHPLALYGATKKANELMAHSYSSLYGLPTTGLRFFTVYGPWGRPDMALFKFTRAILQGEEIEVFNYGKHTRDFTYVEDVVEGIYRVYQQPASAATSFDPYQPDPCQSSAPWRIYNIGNHQPVKLQSYIEHIEQYLGIRAKMKLLPLQQGDVPDTYADVSELQQATGYCPTTPVQEGIKRFLDWYMDYYNCPQAAATNTSLTTA